MSDETRGKTRDLSVRPPERTGAPDLPSTAGPHSPGAVKPEKSAPEAGGYERDTPDHSTNNAKGGYGAG